MRSIFRSPLDFFCRICYNVTVVTCLTILYSKSS
nr:MAG TPA: hypothetical protein [Caudoviricetes sp.]